MAKQRPLRPGDYVRVTTGHHMQGRFGFIQLIYGANRDYEGRALVQFSVAVSMTVPMRYLEPWEGA